ncbi:MAG TPA: PAS domain-containing protein, partial [Allosphingosinicella sp.]|nr:PAS domain-containing protein [Allosphingosinicella sp.]
MSADENVAVLVSGADGELVEAMLRETGIRYVPATPENLPDAIGSHKLAAAVVDEAILSDDLVLALRAVVSGQPAWSNFPFILLMQRTSVSRPSEIIEALGNVGVVERPLEPSILVPNVRAALRSRRRQREAEAYLLQRQEAETRLQQLTESLEARVRARTQDLRSANERLLREIEERRRAEEQLRESEELYRYTVELSQQLVWTASSEGRLLSVSARFTEVTGLDRKVDPHEGWLSVLHPEDEGPILRLWKQILASGEPASVEFRMRLADGSYRTFIAR